MTFKSTSSQLASFFFFVEAEIFTSEAHRNAFLTGITHGDFSIKMGVNTAFSNQLKSSGLPKDRIILDKLFEAILYTFIGCFYDFLFF